MTRVPCRLWVFGAITIRKRGRTIETSGAYQAWNGDQRMERAMARLAGSGSFYWPDVRRAYRRARVLLKTDSTIHQIKVETISGREVCRLYAERGKRMSDYCPDPTANPDDCEECYGWGHRCPVWRATHPESIARVTAAYDAGFDPTRFYPSVSACIAGERRVRAERKATK